MDDWMDWMFTYGWIPICIVGLSMFGFVIWVIIKLLQHWSVI